MVFLDYVLSIDTVIVADARLEFNGDG